jgi:hypothetical protein
MSGANNTPPPDDRQAWLELARLRADAGILAGVRLCVAQGVPAYVVVAALMSIAVRLNGLTSPDDAQARAGFDQLVTIARHEHEESLQAAASPEAERFLQQLRGQAPASPQPPKGVM